MTDVRLAYGNAGRTTLQLSDNFDPRPALLASFYYLSEFERHKQSLHYRDWMMDSGAFSAYNCGAVIDLAAYIDACIERQAADPLLTEIIALDVVGDWRATIRNTERMWKAGIRAIPTYHYGEPECALKAIAAEYDKIALGGMSVLRGKDKLIWGEQCFARVWPKRVHGFALTEERILMRLPFHSVDATTWLLQPKAYGRFYYSKKNLHLKVKGITDLRGQVDHFMQMERRLKQRWANDLAALN